MSIRQRYRVACAVTVALVLGAGALGAYLHPFYLVLALAAGIGGGLYAMAILCPRCEAHPLYSKQRIFGIEITAWGPTMPQQCPNCGLDLS